MRVESVEQVERTLEDIASGCLFEEGGGNNNHGSAAKKDRQQSAGFPGRRPWWACAESAGIDREGSEAGERAVRHKE